MRDKGKLQMALYTRKQAELAALREIKQVRVRAAEGTMAVVTGVCGGTSVRQLKKVVTDRKLVAGGGAVELYFSAVLLSTPVFGSPMADDDTLEACGVLDDDVIYCRAAVEPGKEEVKPSPSKK